ncbi:sugar phosphate isomerase/epimerase [Arthrobacter sp. BHU FT2]|nr:sugar phosphate isomerase/epimerase [Arthrobacter sp. BHU FT2]
MKIGFCAKLEQAERLKAIGYDYIEPPLLNFELADKASLDAAKLAVSRSSLPALVFSSFFPRDMRIVGPEVDEAFVKSYLARVAELCESAGSEVAVMGSAWSRNVPDGFDRQRAADQLLQAYDWAADAFMGSGTVVAIEPQNRKEANIILTLEDAVGFARQVDRPELKVMVDFYHVDEEREPLEHLTTYAEWIAHVQLADTNRQHPGTGSYDFDTFFGHLKKNGYGGHISVEVMHELSTDEMQHSYSFLRGFWPQGPDGSNAPH